jgi:F0F1-type ATP synthase membrane subunit c/vacuolar-type H+-ATPase subunit K
MKEWLLFALMLVVGVAMLVAGVFYLRKEKDDPESVKIYRVVAIIGAALAVGGVLYKIFV